MSTLFETRGRSSGSWCSAPRSTIAPGKPAARKASAARPPACPAPTMTTRSFADIDVNLAVLGFHRVHAHRLGDRGGLRRAGLEVEAPLVQGALDAAVLDV